MDLSEFDDILEVVKSIGKTNSGISYLNKNGIYLKNENESDSLGKKMLINHRSGYVIKVYPDGSPEWLVEVPTVDLLHNCWRETDLKEVEGWIVPDLKLYTELIPHMKFTTLKCSIPGFNGCFWINQEIDTLRAYSVNSSYGNIFTTEKEHPGNYNFYIIRFFHFNKE